MSFDDLPDDWHLRPLTESRLVADVLDLVVSDADRRAGGVSAILCDGSGRMAQPCFVSDDHSGRAKEVEPHVLLHPFLSCVERDPDGGALLLAIVRRDGLSVTEADHRFHRRVIDVCRSRTTLLGVHLVTRYGSRRLPPPPAGSPAA